MLKCASVYTCEIDDHVIALDEIKSQLDDKIKLLKNTVGVIMCNPEFIYGETVEYICAGLPFDVIGITTSSQSTNDEIGELTLTLFVMTSDDIQFVTGVTESLITDIYESAKKAYETASAGHSGLPQLLLVFPPFLLEQFSGDLLVEAWDRILPGVPQFGSLAIDDTATFSECSTIYNGKDSRDTMPFILCYGNIKPRFIIATLDEVSGISLRAEVTKAKDNIVYEINNIVTRDFFMESLGIPESMISIPLLIDSPSANNYDGIPVIREQSSVTAEGAGVFGGNIEVGSKLLLLKADDESILSTSLQGLMKLNNMEDVNGALIFSCVSRRIMLMGVNKSMAELQLVKDTVKPDIPFMMGGSGGEICPTSVRDGVAFNRNHEYSMVILVV
ncbi:MAG: FIST C-terminal domain-containing protein [Oscillospiraceae bacterium]|nr:FIST C-terminal domain-containing protein [Oscillospiraceae bacterium]